MKLKLNKDVFLEKLLFSQRFVSSKNLSSNALQGVLLENKEGKLHFYASNLSSYFHSTMPVEEKTKTEMKVVIEPKKVAEFLSFLSQGNLDIDIEEGKMVIGLGGVKGTFPLIKAEDFPLPPTPRAGWQELKTEFLKENLPLVLFSTAGDESRPVLTGVNIITNEETVFVSTDGFRLSLVRMEKKEGIPTSIIPGSFLEELLRSTEDKKEIEFFYLKEEKLIVFKLGDTSIYTRLIEGEFPPYEKVIPTEKKTQIIVEKEELLRNIRIVAVFAKDLSNIIVFDIKKEKLILRPKIEKGTENKTELEVRMEGEEQKIAFNYRFIVDFLTRSSSKNVIIEVLRPDAPVVFKTEGKENFLHIIMPVRIQEEES